MTAAPSWIRWSAMGLLALQLGWILALPPFRGIDEFDHGYRADAVAHGEWVARPEAATRGTGAVLSVSRAIVDAARPECQRLPYTGPEDCVGEPEGDRIAIASGAGRYNPLYYALVGYPGSLLDGVAALYLMRVVSAVLCTALLAWALTCMSRWSGSRGPLVLLLTLTPMIVYSTAVVAPNGLEMIAGLAFWVALGGLARAPADDRRNLSLAVVSGVLLVSLRSLGPMWALLVFATAILAWPDLRRRLPELLRSRSGQTAAAAGLLSGLASVLWILSQRSLVIGLEETTKVLSAGFKIRVAGEQLLLWPLQSIAAFPLRNEPAPMLVYASYVLVLAAIVVGGFVLAARTGRTAMGVILGLSLLIPWTATVMTMETFGLAWQGRYALPFLVGAAVLAGEAWADRRHRLSLRSLLPLVALVTMGQVAGPTAVLLSEVDVSPQAGTESWWAPNPVLLVVILVTGAVAMTWPTTRSATREGLDGE